MGGNHNRIEECTTDYGRIQVYAMFGESRFLRCSLSSIFHLEIVSIVSLRPGTEVIARRG